MRIAQYPAVLLLHLSRSVYASASSKNTARVQFGENLRLGGFVRRDYQLVSVVSHKGGHNSGHYETFRRQALPEEESYSAPTDVDMTNATRSINSPDGKRKIRRKTSWWGISDERVRKCQRRDVLDMQRGCYLLMYERVDHRADAD